MIPANLSSVSFGLCSKQGNNPKENMDRGYYGIIPGSSTSYAMVADGMGGPGGGKMASEAAVEGARQFLLSSKRADPSTIIGAVLAANESVMRTADANPEFGKMGTTIVLALITDSKIIVGHVGDSRASVFRGDFVKRLTSDHLSIVELGVRGVRVEENIAKRSKGSNVLSRSLGGGASLHENDVDLVMENCRAGDVLMLYSDGVSQFVSEYHMAKILADAGSRLDSTAEKIVDEAIKFRSHDHCTALVARIEG